MRMQFRADQNKGPGTPAHSVRLVEVVTIFAFWLAFVSAVPPGLIVGLRTPRTPRRSWPITFNTSAMRSATRAMWFIEEIQFPNCRELSVR